MYTVVLVDDELWALKGIKNSFDWMSYGFDIIAETTNPVDALDAILQHKPDVVFTDIRMPRLSGLDLMRKARENGIDSEFIIISGFAEFSYAQDAIQQGAFDYRLKPIRIEESENLLQRLSNRLYGKKITKDTEIYDSIMNAKAGALEVLKAAGFTQKHEAFLAAVLETREKGNMHIARRFSGAESLCLDLGETYHVSILNGGTNTLQEFYEFVKTGMTDCDVSAAGVSSISGNHHDILRLLQEADIALNNRFINARESINVFKSSNRAGIKNIVEKVITLEKLNRHLEIRSILSSLPGLFAASSFNLEDVVFLWNQLVAYTSRTREEKTGSLGIKFMEYEQLLNRFKSFAELCELLGEVFENTVPDKHSDQDNKSMNDSFLKLLGYIDENYAGDLYLKELSAHYHINFTYCCDLFKKYTGGTFSDYVTKRRMKKASELLIKTDSSVNEVCMAVGYQNYYYFNKVFKEYHGIPPAKYKKTGSEKNTFPMQAGGTESEH